MTDSLKSTEPADFEPLTTQEAADAYLAAHLPDDITAAAGRLPEVEEQLAAASA